MNTFLESDTDNREFVRRANWGLLFVAVCLILVLGQIYGTRFYIAWGDETVFAEISEFFRSHGVLGAPSFEGNGYRLDEKIYFFPPVYPLLLSGWFQLVPNTLGAARLLSNLVAVLCLVGTWGLAIRLGAKSILPGIVAVGLAIDFQFALMTNWARPDMLACTFSMLALWVYASEKQDGPRSLWRLAAVSAIGTAGMLTHPIGGMIGFFAIPLHILISPTPDRRRWGLWAILFGVPLFGLALWGIYILQDPVVFKYQFIDWQSARKFDRFTGAPMYLGIVLRTFLNINVKGPGLLGLLSVILTAVLWLKVVRERESRRPALLVLLVVTMSSLAVYYGREMPYPPLRLPPFYLALAVCIARPGRFQVPASGREFLNPFVFSPAIAVILLLVMIDSIVGVTRVIKEIRFSERAAAYSPRTLAEEIQRTVPKGSSLGIWIFPDCFDVLAHSGHFLRVNRLSWNRLSKAELISYVRDRNDYIAITDSVLEPRNPKHLIDFTNQVWGATGWRDIASQFYILEKTIVLAGGGITKVYKRDPSKTPCKEPSQPVKVRP